jgi:K+/H+ antiporter YhaU regulatory subunit KhtT
MAKYKVVQNGERIPSGEPVYQVVTTDDLVVVGELMTKKEADAAMKALASTKKAPVKKVSAKQK